MFCNHECVVAIILVRTGISFMEDDAGRYEKSSRLYFFHFLGSQMVLKDKEDLYCTFYFRRLAALQKSVIDFQSRDGRGQHLVIDGVYGD